MAVSRTVKVELGRIGTGQPHRFEMIQDYTGSCSNPEYYFRWVPTYSCLLDSSTIEIAVVGGISPFTWSVSGSDFVLTDETTVGRTNTIKSIYPASMSTSAVVTVEDACGISVSGVVKECYDNPKGTWPPPDILPPCNLVASGDSQGVGLYSVGAVNSFTSVAVGKTFVLAQLDHQQSIAIDGNGVLWGCGFDAGQFGMGDGAVGDTYLNYTELLFDGDVTQIAGPGPIFLLCSDGSLWGSGANNLGQLGIGDYTARTTFTQINEASHKKLARPQGSAMAVIRSDGTLWTTGYNRYGTLGLEDNTTRNIFTQVGSDTDWADVELGRYHLLALKEDGSLYVTGYNNHGQLGLGDKTARNTLAKVDDNSYISISAYYYHSHVVRSDGALLGTGYNAYGQIGIGESTDDQVNFVRNTGGGEFAQVACGYNFTFAQTAGGVLSSCGNNGSGQLGVGDNITKRLFTSVSKGVVRFTCGFAGILALEWE